MGKITILEGLSLKKAHPLLSEDEAYALVGILLFRDNDPELTFAAAKAKGYLKNKEALKSLMKKQCIQIEGMNLDGTSETPEMAANINEVMDFFMKKSGRNVKLSGKANRTAIKGRLNDGYTVEECKIAIANRVEEWSGNPTMSRYIRIETIFRASKFDSYLSDAQYTKVGIAEAKQGSIDLKPGDILTKDNVGGLEDDVYYKVYKTTKKPDGTPNMIAKVSTTLSGSGIATSCQHSQYSAILIWREQ